MDNWQFLLNINITAEPLLVHIVKRNEMCPKRISPMLILKIAIKISWMSTRATWAHSIKYEWKKKWILTLCKCKMFHSPVYYMNLLYFIPIFISTATHMHPCKKFKSWTQSRFQIVFPVLLQLSDNFLKENWKQVLVFLSWITWMSNTRY